MAKQYKYHNPKKVIEHGERIYIGGAWGRFLKRMPQVDNGKILIGILAPNYGADTSRVGAMEITDEKVFEDFGSSYGASWFFSGGTAFLYALPKERADECRSDSDEMVIFKSWDLEKLTQANEVSAR